MHKLRLPLAVLLTLLLVHSGCTDRNRNPPQKNFLANISQVGGVLADPARDRILVTDRIGGRVLAVDGDTGELEDQVALSTTVTVMAADCCGNQLFVATPDRSEIAVIDLETFQVVDELPMPNEPSSMVWREPDTLLAATDAGIERIQFTGGTLVTSVLRNDVGAPALLGLSRNQKLLFVAETLMNGVRVVRIRLNEPQDPLIENANLTGKVLLVAPSHDDKTLYVATDAGLFLLNASDLQEQRRVDLGADVRAAALSETTTRLFVARGSVVEWRETRKFKFGGDTMAGGDVTSESLMVDPSSTTALVHTSLDRVETYEVVGPEVHSLPVIRLGEMFDLQIRGNPGDNFQLFFNLDPAVTFLDPPGTPERRFLDLDATNLFLLLAGTFDATGEVNRQFHPQANEPFAGIECVVQLITEGPGGALREVSNPQHLVFIPQNCPRP